MYTDIKVISFAGKAIQSYISSIARLKVEICREYPFLQEKELEEEKRLLKKYTQSKEAIAIIVFNGSAIVGASTGLPLELESKMIQKPFIEQKLDPKHFFFFSESLLLKEYRGRGIGHHFFDLREAHTQQFKRFHYICFYDINRSAKDAKKQEGFFTLHDFWRKRGYSSHPELRSCLSWKDCDEEKPSEKSLTFWVKTLFLEKNLEKRSLENPLKGC